MAAQARPLELLQLETHLMATFDQLLPPSSNADVFAAQSDFLSRALAAYALMAYAGCDAATAAAAVIDGKGDAGIDALYIDPVSRLWVVQSKWYRAGRGQPAQADTEKFATGLGRLLKGDFSLLQTNAKAQVILPAIRHQLNEYNKLQVHGLIVYTGDTTLGELQRAPLDDLEDQYCERKNYLTISGRPLSMLHDTLSNVPDALGVDSIDLEIHEAGQVANPHEVIYGRVRLADIAKLVEVHGPRLIASNIRAYMGDTPVNARLLHTLVHEPNLFFYLNNGLVAYCDRFDVRNSTAARTIPDKKVRARNFCIINGAQTAWAIAEHFRRAPNAELEGWVFLRLISLEKATNNVTLAAAITEASNFQNAVQLQDLAANKPDQVRWAAHLKLGNVHYHYKLGVDTPPSDDSNFTIAEAVTALACLSDRPHLTALIVRNREDLFSVQPTYPSAADPAEELALTFNYQQVFTPALSARDMWRAVQVQRCLCARCDELSAYAEDRDRDLTTYGRWLALHAILSASDGRLIQSEALSLSADDRALVTRATDAAVDHLREALSLRDQTYETLFGDTSECQALLKAAIPTLRKLFSP